MTLRVALALLIAALICGGHPLAAEEQSAAPAIPAIDVAAAPAEEVDWQEKISSIGVAEALQGVDISGSESGNVVEILFDSGTKVKAGQPLVKLDTSKEDADLKATLAQIPAAKTDLDRKKQLLKSGAVGQSDVDDAQSKHDTLVAESGSLKATIARRSLKAPFGGVLGIRKVNLGQYLQPGDQVANLQDLSVMRMRFLVAQKDFGKIKIGQPIEARFDAYPDDVFKGKISTIEPSVKYQSGIIPVQADVPNSEEKLLPGMYASLDVLLPGHSKKVVVPAGAVTFNLYGESVYVVDQTAGTVQQVTVQTGPTRGNLVIVEKGLKAGDLVVVAGQLKLSNGSKVKVVEGQTLPEMTAVPVQ
jgi:membrane fusion protein (multidrug efflux system)